MKKSQILIAVVIVLIVLAGIFVLYSSRDQSRHFNPPITILDDGKIVAELVASRVCDHPTSARSANTYCTIDDNRITIGFGGDTSVKKILYLKIKRTNTSAKYAYDTSEKLVRLQTDEGLISSSAVQSAGTQINPSSTNYAYLGFLIRNPQASYEIVIFDPTGSEKERIKIAS